ncbi:flagellar hook-associated protein FlgK [Candidatus Sodalis sp. SoCistrobi]|uniref:flagellar hook-associated protein FlgK n=1 Tax=Candidatus Sodalis sp. SoCistrobi TaxID=1922216 RepID=UPI00093FEA9E|nr:flagellar hook-associated protein FlgK [Candidatus Sodalis sp. SoCistrobi]
MSSPLYSIASSGLKAAQIALATTSNNISNAYVDGYNLQRVTLSEAQQSGALGNGVTITGISRAYDSLVVGQLRAASTSAAAASTYSDNISQIDNLLSDSDTDLSTQMSTFFASLQALSSAASDSAARQTVIGSGQNLVSQFSSLDNTLRDMDSAIDSQLSATADQINTYAQQIANLNAQIARQGTGSESNALLDQRDQLVNSLNELVGVNVTVQDDSTLSLTIGSGLTLVQGSSAYSLAVVPSAADASQMALAYDRGNGTLSEIDPATLSGGSLGGMLSFRDGALADARNQLGQIALAFADSFNQQHQAGVDLNGDAGGDFFTLGSPTVVSNTRNTGSAVLSVAFSDSTAAKASDYTAKYTADGWQITRNSDGASVAYTTSTDAGGATVLSFEGLSMSVSGTPSVNDSYQLKTVSNVIQGLSVAITDPGLIAAGQADDESGDGDNRNAEALLALQNTKLVGGSATLSTAYASLVSKVGTETSNAKITATTQASMVSQLTEKQQSISGVNLDEEYVDLQRYQQYYQANSRVMTTAGTIFDALLSALG